MSTCNWLDLQTLGSQPVMPKNLPDHYTSLSQVPSTLPKMKTYIIKFISHLKG